MLMKVFNKGQVVIPVEIRKQLSIEIGDKLNFTINSKTNEINISKPVYSSKKLAGSLHKYAKNKSYPSKDKIRTAMAKAWAEKNEG